MQRSGLIALVAIGCGHAAPPATPPPPPRPVDAGVAVDARPLDEDLPALATRALRMYQDWQRALAEAGEDCAAATAKTNAVADANADVIAANTKLLHAGPDRVKALRAALEDHASEFDAAAKAIVQSPAMAKCHDDPAFARAVDRIGGEH